MEKVLSPLDLKMLKQQVENQEFVITVVGAMKSGKSSFTNALLGHDLMPNENQACTLTSTDIAHQEHDHKVTKSYESGKNQILESENLSSVFHEDVRKSRTREHKEFYTYKVNYPIYGLKKYPFLHDTKFILMDTPGLNEMEGLGVKKETIEKVFSHALKRTDLLLFVLDVQYYKSEENLQIIEKIRQQRPDLLESIVFVLNKVDKLRDRDGSSEYLISKVKELLQSWGVKANLLHPVSARKALVGRLMEQGIDTSSLNEEIASYLPTKTIEVAGETITVQIPIATAYPQLIEESGILQLEEQILEDTYLQVGQKLNKSTLDRLQQVNKQIDKILATGTTNINRSLTELKTNLHDLQFRFSSLEKLANREGKSRNEIEVILKNIGSQANVMKQKSPYSISLKKLLNLKSSYDYRYVTEASQVGTSRFDEWFRTNTEPLFQKVLSHYQGLLDYKPNMDNFFYSISQSVTKILKETNGVISTCSKDLPDIQLHKLLDQIEIRPQGLTNIPNVDWKYKDFVGKITTDSQTTEWEESFLIFFTQKKSRTEYLYNITAAVKSAEKYIQSTITNLSEEWHKDTIQKRYMDVSATIKKMVQEPLIQMRNKIESSIKDTKLKINQLESNIALLHAELLELQNLQSNLGFRTDLITKRKSITVNPKKQSLDQMISKVESGTTLLLQEGSYRLNQKHLNSKSIALIGVGQGLTTLEISNEAGINVIGKHGILLEGISFHTVSSGNLFELDCLEIFIEDCQFSGDGRGSAVHVKGMAEGYIQRSRFSTFEKAVNLENNSRLELSSNDFNYNNQSAITVQGNADLTLIENTFTDNKIGTMFVDQTQGYVERNTWADNLLGIKVGGGSKPIILGNTFKKNKECGISLHTKANATIVGNTIIENGLGVSCIGDAKARINKNMIKDNRAEGIFISENGSVDISDNQLVQNESGFVITSKGRAVITGNYFQENRKHGIVCTQESILNASANKIYSNNLVGMICEDSSEVNLKNNEISSNQIGIQLIGKTKFILERNQCNENKEFGMAIEGEAKGRANQNVFNHNQNGVYLAGKSSIVLQENTMNENAENGIVCVEKMSGRILNNSCLGNGSFAIHVRNILRLEQKDNEGRGSLERSSSLSYWINRLRKLTSNLLGKTIKREDI